MLCFPGKAAIVICAALPIAISAQTAKPGVPSQAHPQVGKPSPVFSNPNLLQSASSAPVATRTSRPGLTPRAAAPLAVRAAQPLQPTLQQLQANVAIAAPKAPVMPPAPEPVAPAAPLPNADSDGVFAVDYREGQLSVVAEKAELGKVLRMLGTKTGASIEVAPEVAAEPVVARLGPGMPHQILSELLDSPHLEYIVMGSDEDGQSLQRIVVRKRASFGRQPLVAMKASPAQPDSEMTKPEAADQEAQVGAQGAQQQDSPPRQ